VGLCGHGDDVPEWLADIGFILSTSEHEGSHQAVAEGMASGAIPVIRNWIGADLLYPERYVVRSSEDAVQALLRWSEPDVRMRQSELCREFARESFDHRKILRQYDALIEELCARDRG
jgi:glycosyltransferase involved in cell wall biosynthesis